MKHIAEIKSLRCLEGDRQWCITPKDLAKVINQCKELQYIFMTRIEGPFEAVFTSIANSQSIVRVEFEECESINNKCIDILMKPNSCPKLKVLGLNGCRVTNSKYKEIKKKMKGVSIDISS